MNDGDYLARAAPVHARPVQLSDKTSERTPDIEMDAFVFQQMIHSSNALPAFHLEAHALSRDSCCRMLSRSCNQLIPRSTLLSNKVGLLV